MTSLTLIPVLAAGNGAGNFEMYKLILVVLFMLGAPLLKKISEVREQAERAKNAKPPGGRPPAVPPRRENEVRAPDAARNANAAESPRRENPFRNEIEQFLEEVGRRRPNTGGPQRGNDRGTTAAAAMPRPVPLQQGAQRTTIQRTAGATSRAKPETAKPPIAAAKIPPLSRPGEDLAQRKAPVSDDLGAQVRAHLTQYLESSRLSQRARADLGTAVERAVREHLGSTATAGLATADDPAKATANVAGTPIVALLRNPSGVRTAILVNEILERPKCLRRKT